MGEFIFLAFSSNQQKVIFFKSGRGSFSLREKEVRFLISRVCVRPRARFWVGNGIRFLALLDHPVPIRVSLSF